MNRVDDENDDDDDDVYAVDTSRQIGEWDRSKNVYV